MNYLSLRGTVINVPHLSKFSEGVMAILKAPNKEIKEMKKV